MRIDQDATIEFGALQVDSALVASLRSTVDTFWPAARTWMDDPVLAQPLRIVN